MSVSVAIAAEPAAEAQPAGPSSESRLPGLFKLVWIFFMGGQTLAPVKQLLGSVFCECGDIAKEKNGRTQSNASILQKLSLIYYLDVRTQARLSFVSALVAAVVGMLLFFYAAALAMPRRSAPQSVNITLWAGGLTQFISAVSFFLYFKAARQFATFHVCLERMNRYLWRIPSATASIRKQRK
jgi:hypothetical protein